MRFSNAGIAGEANNNRDEPVAGGGLPSPPVAGMVELDDGTVVPFIIGAVGDSPLESSLPTPPTTGTQPKSLTYWLIGKVGRRPMNCESMTFARPRRHARSRGFTLIELMVVLTIAALLFAIGVPIVPRRRRWAAA